MALVVCERGEHRRVAGRPDGQNGYDNEDGLEYLDALGEEVHAEVDGDEDDPPLREDAEKIFGGSLCAAGHGGRRSA